MCASGGWLSDIEPDQVSAVALRMHGCSWVAVMLISLLVMLASSPWTVRTVARASPVTNSRRVFDLAIFAGALVLLAVLASYAWSFLPSLLAKARDVNLVQERLVKEMTSLEVQIKRAKEEDWDLGAARELQEKLDRLRARFDDLNQAL